VIYLDLNFEKAPISFVQISTLHTNDSGEEYLTFNIWEELDDTINVSTYRCIMKLDDAIEILEKIQKRGIPCNYYLGQLRDRTFLVGLAKSSTNVFVNTNITQNIIKHIEFKPREDSIYNLIVTFINNGVEFFDEGLNRYFSMTNLVLNRTNTNLSVRIFTQEDGFRTRFIQDIFSKEILLVRALEPIGSLHTLDEWKQQDDGYWYNKMVVVAPTLDNYQISVNGQLVKDIQLYDIIALDFYLKEFGRYYYMTLISNFLSAWISFFSSNDLEMPKQKQEYQKSTRAVAEKTIEIKVPYRIPRIVDFKRLLAESDVIKDENKIQDFLSTIQSLYGDIVYEYLRNFILKSKKSLYARYINIKVLDQEIKYKLAIRTVRAAIIKTTMLADTNMRRLFNYHTENATTYLNSPIFKYSICITIYKEVDYGETNLFT
jgi:hypothetical protein